MFIRQRIFTRLEVMNRMGIEQQQNELESRRGCVSLFLFGMAFIVSSFANESLDTLFFLTSGRSRLDAPVGYVFFESTAITFGFVALFFGFWFLRSMRFVEDYLPIMRPKEILTFALSMWLGLVSVRPVWLMLVGPDWEGIAGILGIILGFVIHQQFGLFRKDERPDQQTTTGGI
jgi:hypothetical protein